MRRWIALAFVLAACDEGGGTFESSASSTTPPRPGSGGGFSADLAKSIEGGSGEPSGSAGSAGSGTAGAGSAKPASDDKVAAGSGSAGSGSAAAGSAKPASDDKVAAGTGSAGPGSAAAGSAKPASDDKVAAGSAKPTSDDKVAAGSAKPPEEGRPRVPVKPPPELAAIRLSLSPNWERDLGEAGTISLEVKVRGTTKTRVFSFRYGYEDPKAPADRDAYKKWLAANKILVVKNDRQRGAAWYLEGTDRNGAPVFRYVVKYGGKRLICGGSTYHDPISNQLGDIRDKTVIQAKEICESVSL